MRPSVHHEHVGNQVDQRKHRLVDAMAIEEGHVLLEVPAQNYILQYSSKADSSNVREGGTLRKPTWARHVGAMHGRNLRKFTETHPRAPCGSYLLIFFLIIDTVIE